jgi:hypothetical protein
MAAKKAALESAPPLTSQQIVERAASRACRLATASRLASIIRARDHNAAALMTLNRTVPTDAENNADARQSAVHVVKFLRRVANDTQQPEANRRRR